MHEPIPTTFNRWWQRLRQARLAPATQQDGAIPDALWLDTLAAYPFLKQRSLDDLWRLRQMAGQFLRQKEFHTTGGLPLTDAMAVAIAAQACVPVLQLGLDWYDSFVGIVVHPGVVLAHREWADDDGIVHEGAEELAGEAMPGGPVMLSWEDVELGHGADPAAAGYNVVIHEFAHVLDLRNGIADGTPPLPDRPALTQWQQVMADEYAQFCAAVEAGTRTWLDPYAAQAPAELFAVASEAFFVAPQAFRQHHPRLHHLLAGFYRQDPTSPMKKGPAGP